MRKLTGKFYLKKRFWGGYDVFIEIESQIMCEFNFDWSPVKIYYVKATIEDLKGLGISGILTEEEWYVKKEKDKNLLGINL
jgi:hypothetical protein